MYMVEYSCTICKKIFDRKSSYINHANKKYPCKTNPNLILLNPKNPNILNNIKNISCLYCGKLFFNNSNLNKHLKNNSCKAKKEDDENKENIFKLLLEKEILLENEKLEKEQLNNKMTILEKQLNDLTNQIKELSKKQVSINNGTINNNNIQNNFIISSDKLCKFGNEKLEKIDNKLFNNVTKKIGKDIIVECAKNIYNDSNNPQNKTMYISDLSREKCMTWSGEDWDLMNLNKAMITVQTQIQKYFNANKEKYDKLKDPKIKADFDIRVKKYYKLYYEEFDDDDFEPSKERVEQFQKSVNNDLIKFFYNIRNDVKNNFEEIKKTFIEKKVFIEESTTLLQNKKSRGRPKKII